MKDLAYRQVHLDFHTSERIHPIGSGFSAEDFQQALQAGHVSSITLFSKCHHGWSYHPTRMNKIHPGLDFDLLGEQIKACKAISVRTPVYLSAGLDQKTSLLHPEWIVVPDEKSIDLTPPRIVDHYNLLCLNSPYLDELLSQIGEVVQQYDCDEIFLDIVGVRLCYCQSCLRTLASRGEDYHDGDTVRRLAVETYYYYTAKVRELIDRYKPGLPVFHNGGHIQRGNRRMAFQNTHLEIESLPTGGWGYDHFPLSAAYARTLEMKFTGMTGKFHTSWADFGGYKHPNALRYETALSLATGAGCCIGDQLHPDGRMDPATYDLIGKAYAEIEKKEDYCKDTRLLADIAVLSVEAYEFSRDEENGMQGVSDNGARGASDTGACRMLLEGHYLFDFIDVLADFSRYKVIVLPDTIICIADLKTKLTEYVKAGGKLLATGQSGLDGQSEFTFDFGCRHTGRGIYEPSYIHPLFLLDCYLPANFVMKHPNENIAMTDEGVLHANKIDPYFNRRPGQFSSHQHTPCDQSKISPAIAGGKDGIYCCFQIFRDYADFGHLISRKLFEYMMDGLLQDQKSLRTNLLSSGITTLMKKEHENRLINHLLYAPVVKRGNGIEIIEDIPPVLDTNVQIRLGARPVSVKLVPQNTDIGYTYTDGKLDYTVDSFECHQMVEISF